MNGPSYVVVGVLIILFVLALRKACRTIFDGGCGCHGGGGDCCRQKKHTDNKKPPCCQ